MAFYEAFQPEQRESSGSCDQYGMTKVKAIMCAQTEGKTPVPPQDIVREHHWHSWSIQ